MSWAIEHVSPIGGSIFGDQVLTLTGYGFDLLQRVQYNPRKTMASIKVISADATVAQQYRRWPLSAPCIIC